MTNENVGQMEAGESKRRSTKLLYATLFLVVATTAFLASWSGYSHHLVQTREFNRVVRVTPYFDILAAGVGFLELVIVLLIFFPHETATSLMPTSERIRSHFMRNIGLGFLAGLIAFIVTVPIFLGDKSNSLALFFDNHFYDFGGVALLIIAVLLLPVASEIFFRGILFRHVLESTSLAPALIASVLLFAFVWPMFNQIAAVILAVIAGLLFYRTRSVLACVVANSFFTVLVASLLVLHTL